MIRVAPSTIAGPAAEQACRAAERAGVGIEEVSDAGELAQTTRLYGEVWGRRRRPGT
jgi:hypothetical protein